MQAHFTNGQHLNFVGRKRKGFRSSVSSFFRRLSGNKSKHSVRFRQIGIAHDVDADILLKKAYKKCLFEPQKPVLFTGFDDSGFFMTDSCGRSGTGNFMGGKYIDKRCSQAINYHKDYLTYVLCR